MSLEAKFQNLKKYIKSLKSAAVAFSSGVDSTFLLKVAHDVLGNNVLALTMKSSLCPAKEYVKAVEFCRDRGIEHVTVEMDETCIKGFVKNPENRCYLCKREIFKSFLNRASLRGLACVIEGSNLDDTKDYRPGLRALEELNIISPLLECALTKEEIRVLSKREGLSTWDKPSFACLASRIPYGEVITKEKLKMIENAEDVLRSLGFSQFRVRCHNHIARIEILCGEFEKLLSVREKVAADFKSFGFKYVTMDLLGYRTGSLNENLG